MTPVELNACVMAYVDRRRDDQELVQANMYTLSMLIRVMVWSEHPPSYEEAFNGSAEDGMSDEQIYAKVRAINALLGGEEVD